MAMITQMTISYFFQPKTFAPAHTGMMILMTIANPLPSRLSTFSNEGMTSAPTTARTARIIRMVGRKMDFSRSRRSCWISAAVATGSREGDGVRVDEGELGSVT